MWTVAQLFNFKVVPLEYRPVFGKFKLSSKREGRGGGGSGRDADGDWGGEGG